MEAEQDATNMQSDIPTSSTDPISALISDSLKQQAAQFEAIISGLRDQMNDFKDLGGTSSRRKTTSNATPDVSSKRDRLKQSSSSQNVYSTPSSSAKKAPRKSKTPLPPPEKPASPSLRKRHPLQVTSIDLPKDFKSTKEALFVHIKVLWGLFNANDVPSPVDPTLLKEFYSRFTTVEEVEAVVANPGSANLVAKNDILTLRSLRSGTGGKIGRGMANLDHVYILYIHGVLAKVGLRVWGPDLNNAADSLYNSACRITALNTFHQLMATGAYNYMNVNPLHAESMSEFIKAYNHYVHYWMAGKYKSELKAPGRADIDSSRKVIQKHRERLRKVRLAFLKDHRAKYPPRYISLCDNILAHSDDEEEPGKNYLTIKTLPYRSKNASKFFRRLDIEIQKAAQASKKAVPKVERRLPKTPIPTAFPRAPRDLPIDFYKPSWFNELPAGQKRLIPDATQVALLPDASESLLPHPRTHPDEKLSDKVFNAKYLDIYLQSYEISDHEDEEDEESDHAGSSTSNTKMNFDEDDSDFYDEGDFGDLYEDSDEEAEGKGKGKAKGN